MLSVRDRNRLKAIGRLAPAGPTIVVATSAKDDALEVAALALAAGRRAPVAVAGPLHPLTLRAGLSDPHLYGRIQASIGSATALSNGRRTPAALVYLSAAGLGAAGLKAHGNAWARHVRAGGYLALWGGDVGRLEDLGVTPRFWDGYSPRGRIELVRRRPVG